MKVTTFAAIEIASYEVSMKIYALLPKTMKEITYVRHRMELGKDAYRLGKISNVNINPADRMRLMVSSLTQNTHHILCAVLKSFLNIL